jgi:hypothetical protein
VAAVAGRGPGASTARLPVSATAAIALKARKLLILPRFDVFGPMMGKRYLG